MEENLKIINEIAQTSNHQQYLDRMDNSFQVSSKKFILDFIKGKNILDVGCGSGVLIRKLISHDSSLNIVGIDLNEKSVDFCTNQGLNVKQASIDDFYFDECQFDTIIFSSVLHEFSSYAPEKARFTILPIVTALKAAYRLLKPGGRIIIRDGIKGSNDEISLLARSNDEVCAFNRYMKDTPISFESNYNISGLVMTSTEKLLKEFLFTYTWGEESYSREINEQYGILTIDEWKNVVKFCRFKINNMLISSEEYAKYLSTHFYESELDNIFEQSTILLVATK